jgi:hypothetical protein
MSFLAENFWAENKMSGMVDWVEKRKLAEKYFNEISIIGDHF